MLLMDYLGEFKVECDLRKLSPRKTKPYYNIIKRDWWLHFPRGSANGVAKVHITGRSFAIALLIRVGYKALCR